MFKIMSFWYHLVVYLHIILSWFISPSNWQIVQVMTAVSSSSLETARENSPLWVGKVDWTLGACDFTLKTSKCFPSIGILHYRWGKFTHLKELEFRVFIPNYIMILWFWPLYSETCKRRPFGQRPTSEQRSLTKTSPSLDLKSTFKCIQCSLCLHVLP